MIAHHIWSSMPNTFYMYKVNMVHISMKGMGGPDHILQHVPREKPTQYPTTQLTLLEWWYGMVLHPYGHPPHIKHAKHLLYVWTESCISMKRMGGPNHILQRVPSEKPTQNPTTGPWPNPYSDGMVWCCGIMTASHGWRLLNTFYRYGGDLVRVWSGSSLNFVLCHCGVICICTQ